LALGAPKKAVRDPCLSFFGVEEDTAAETEDVAFLLALMVDGNRGDAVDLLIDGKLHAPISGPHPPRGLKLLQCNIYEIYKYIQLVIST
jgi:hypothetical protein